MDSLKTPDMIANNAFRDGLDHLVSEMRLIRLALSEEVEAMARRFEADPDGPLRGYGITPVEAKYQLEKADEEPGKEPFPYDSGLAELIRARVEKSAENNVELPLIRLRDCFGLSRFEMDILLTCILPEFYPGFGKVFGFLQDDATLQYPTAGFLIELYCKRLEDRKAAWHALHSTSPLRRWSLLVPTGEEEQTPPLKRSYRVDERVVTYLMGGQYYDKRLEGKVSVSEPDVANFTARNSSIDNIVRKAQEGGGCQIITLAGADKDRSEDFVMEAARMLGRKVLRAEISSLCRQGEWDLSVMDTLLREAVLQPAVLLLKGENVRSMDHATDITPLLGLFGKKGKLVFIVGKTTSGANGFENGVDLERVEIDFPGPSERLVSWRDAMEKNGFSWPEVFLEQLAMRYPASKGRINDFLARHKTHLNGGDAEKSFKLLTDTINALTRMPLDGLARRVEPYFEWEDLVVHKYVSEHLKAFRNMVAHQFVVYEKWGLGKKMPRGKATTALFCGPPGTGKTMAAEVIANDLGIDLYRVDLAGLVSKYIGETEKNIKKVFEGIAGSNAILFFDEADSLFGRRTEIKDSHDRYANLEVNYLLQRLEEHDGPVILATNLKKNMDEAFLRRLHFIVDFPLPSEPMRQMIFQRYLPESVPKAGDVDIPFLAKHFEISGGDIRNTALQAAFMAAGDGGLVTMEHLLVALRREYLKLGKTFPASLINHRKGSFSETPENRRRKKEVTRLGY